LAIAVKVWVTRYTAYREIMNTYDAPEEASAKTCTVPLSLQTHNSLSSGRNATPYISALSVPLRNSRTSFPV
jgi:hypothetical protein